MGEELSIWPVIPSYSMGKLCAYLVFWMSANYSGGRATERKDTESRFRTWSVSVSSSETRKSSKCNTYELGPLSISKLELAIAFLEKYREQRVQIM